MIYRRLHLVISVKTRGHIIDLKGMLPFRTQLLL